MSDTVIDRCLDLTTKEDSVSKEANLSPPVVLRVAKMRLSIPVNLSFTGDVNQEPIKRHIYLEAIYGVHCAVLYLYLFLEDAENPGVLHYCGFIGPNGSAVSGIGYYSVDVTTTGGQPLFEVLNRCLEGMVNLTVAERTTQLTQRDYNRVVNLVANNGHTDLLQLSINHCVVSTSPFVRLKCVGLYQVIDNGTPGGNPLQPSWHRVEAASEAFVYRPSCPKVEDIHPQEVTFYQSDQGDTASCNVVVKLHRKLLLTGNGYDQLNGAKLVLSDGTELPIDNVYVTEEQDRVNLDLRDCLSTAFDHPQAPDRFLAKVRLLGVTGGDPPGRDWGTGTLSDVIVVQKLPWLQSPPSKRERRLVKYNESNLVEDDFYFG